MSRYIPEARSNKKGLNSLLFSVLYGIVVQGWRQQQKSSGGWGGGGGGGRKCLLTIEVTSIKYITIKYFSQKNCKHYGIVC